jgi:hypothetical protein
MVHMMMIMIKNKQIIDKHLKIHFITHRCTVANAGYIGATPHV